MYSQDFFRQYGKVTVPNKEKILDKLKKTRKRKKKMTKTEFFKKATDNLYHTYDNNYVSKPLDYCNAKIIFNDNYIALKSYYTIVAIIDRNKKL